MNAVDVLCAQLTHDLFAIAKFLLVCAHPRPWMWRCDMNGIIFFALPKISGTINDVKLRTSVQWCAAVRVLSNWHREARLCVRRSSRWCVCCIRCSGWRSAVQSGGRSKFLESGSDLENCTSDFLKILSHYCYIVISTVFWLHNKLH